MSIHSEKSQEPAINNSDTLAARLWRITHGGNQHSHNISFGSGIVPIHVCSVVAIQLWYTISELSPFSWCAMNSRRVHHKDGLPLMSVYPSHYAAVTVTLWICIYTQCMFAWNLVASLLSSPIYLLNSSPHPRGKCQAKCNRLTLSRSTFSPNPIPHNLRCNLPII